MADLDAVERLAVGSVGLAADVIADAGLGHQVAFVGRIDENLARELTSALHDNLHDAGAVLDHAFLKVEAFSVYDRHFVSGGLEHLVVDRGGHVGLEGPHRTFVGSVAVGALGEIFLARLVGPLGIVGVVLRDGGIEFAGDPADGLLIADISGAETAGGQTAEELGRFDEHGRTAFACGLDGRGDPARGAAVDDDVLGGEGGGETEQGKQQGAHGDAPMSAGPGDPAIPFLKSAVRAGYPCWWRTCRLRRQDSGACSRRGWPAVCC